MGFRRHSDKIKTHHNVGGLPLKMEFKGVIEPQRNLGSRLGLPYQIVYRQPFPGPGLAVRIMGEVDEEKLEILRRVDSILQEEVEASGVGRASLAILHRPNGHYEHRGEGDKGAYGWVLAIRLVESVDGMTARFHKAQWELLERISTRITNEIPEATGWPTIKLISPHPP